MRYRIARWLRKWADLIDPKAEPGQRHTITISADTEEFNRELDAAIAKVNELRRLFAFPEAKQ